MVKRQFVCKNCGNKFSVEVFEEGEADKKRLKGVPVSCPKCRSTNVERA